MNLNHPELEFVFSASPTIKKLTNMHFLCLETRVKNGNVKDKTAPEVAGAV